MRKSSCQFSVDCIISLFAQISALYGFIHKEFRSGALERDLTGLKDIGKVRSFQGHVGVLFDQKNRHTLAVDFPDDDLNDDLALCGLAGSKSADNILAGSNLAVSLNNDFNDLLLSDLRVLGPGND